MDKIGLVLSGGGARGVAHLGVIKALNEYNIPIDIISGTSAGAIIGGFYSAGYSTNDILKLILEIKLFKFLQPALSVKGLLKMDQLAAFLEKHLSATTFKELKIPLTIAATDVYKGQTEYFTDGTLVPAICASSCIPVMFSPIQVNGGYYIDGGIMNNLPAEPIRKQCQWLIGSHTNPVDNEFEFKNVSAMIERSLMLAISKNASQSAALCDILIEPKLYRYKVLDLNHAKDIFSLGYKEATSVLKNNKIIASL